jgi:hypothetical protein
MAWRRGRREEKARSVAKASAQSLRGVSGGVGGGERVGGWERRVEHADDVNDVVDFVRDGVGVDLSKSEVQVRSTP